MPQKPRRKRKMIVVDEREPVGELPPPFPPRNVEVKEDVDMRKYYDLKKEIGRGRFGTVYLVTDKTTGQKFAAKFVNTKRNQDRANVEREVEIMKLLNAERPHPRLIQLYDAFDMDKEMCLVLEVVDGGELFERVIDDDFVLTEKACAIFMRQVCEAVEFIHSKNILHLDMKPENILCLSREGNRIKICDFGLARKYDPRKKLQVLFGTPEFVAPEVVNFEPISFGTDMWSVGVISYVLLSGLSPFMGHNYVETMTNVTHNKYDFSDEAFNCVSDDAKDFIEKLLVLDKSLRLTPAQCQRHPWLKAKKQVKRKEEEELERTKKNLKEFVERWNSHPNSPYLIGTPLTQLPPELQRIAREEGWSSRASFSSVIVAPPSPPPGELSDDDEDDDDDLDLSNKDEFSHYTFEQRQPSPKRLASQLEVKLSQLKEDNDGRKEKDQDKAGVENEKINKKASETLPSDKHKKDDNDKLSVSKPETKKENLEKERSKTPEITKKENEKNKKTEEKQETVAKSKDGEKPAGGLQKCSSTVFLDDPKKAYQEYQKMVNEAIKKKQEEKKALEERIRARQEELEREASKDYDWRKTKDKKDTRETKTSGTNYLKTKETANVADEKRSRGSKSPVSVYSSTKATDEQLDDHKQAYEDYKRRVSKSEKDAKKNEDTGKAKPREPLRRPEIIALQNEELGGSTARQRKKSLSRLDTGDSLSDRSSRGSTPKSPGLDGATSPKYDFDLEAGRSRSSTPTKQLKKQPSRDVPLQAKNADQEERPGTPVRQKPSRDVPMPYITVEGEDRYSRPRRGSRDITPDSPLPPHRKISAEERPPSRESRPGTPLSHRRPSRDVNISSGQLDRLVQASGLDSPELTADQPQMWPDLIVCPQGQDDEECQDYKDSLDVPIATLMKSPSGTLRQVPEVTILQTESKNLDSEGNSSDPTYVPNNKLVAWILDIGNVQNQRQAPFSTSDRVSQWEGKEPSPKPGDRSPREKSPRLRTRSPVPSDKHRDKSPAQPRTPFLCPLSREPSSVSLKSSGSSENACIQTPWGELKRSPSRSTLSKSPSFEVPSNKAKDGTDPGNGGFDDHMSVGSSTRSPSPRSYSKFHKQDSMEIPERKDSLTSPRLTGELPPKPPEKAQRSSKEENLNIRSQAKKDDWKSATLPRHAKLAKHGSTDSLKNYSTEKRSSLMSVEEGNTDSLKRKSKFPPSPNQKRKLGSCLLFSAQDRISQFENKQPSSRPPQRPITRTRSSMVFTSTAQENGLENRLSCDVNKNALTSSLNSSYTPSKSCNNTHVEFLRGRLLGKTTKTTGLPPGIIQNVDSVNNNNKRFSIGYARRDSIGYGNY
ncbi:serine/arginine repetitive matrix protein 1-like [Penaeus chinensis]|uniref:serine/arginine repetitive matrix protein 1-like n=1 Tax=Penaeus chinensis TaxID=139456 RepID=UPI001FB70D1B|nr:serine/arginine repetitive matrix protein 1-like [Penaeus chinensis]